MLNNQNMKKNTHRLHIYTRITGFILCTRFVLPRHHFITGSSVVYKQMPSTEHFVYKHEICTNSARGQLIPTLLMFRFNIESIIIVFIKFHSLPLLESLVIYSGQRWKCDDSSMTSQLRHRPVTSLRMRTTVTLQETWNVLPASSSERVFIVI